MPTIHTNGIEMHYIERGDPRNPVAVLMHAATVEGAALAWASRAMSRMGFYTIAPDVRGHGATPNPLPHLHMPTLVDDYLGFLEGLDLLPAHGFGYSMGGAITLYAALRRPEWFKSLVLLGTNYKPASIPRTERIVGPVSRRSPIERAVFDNKMGIRVGWGTDPAEFRALEMPVLIIQADRDDFIDIEDSLPLYRSLPNADYVVVPHATHLRLVNHPIVVKAMERFYARIGK